MSKIDENEIRRRLKALSQVEPASESADRALQRLRDTMMNKEKVRESTSTKIWRTIFKSSIVKLAAAAVLLIGVGYAAGRLLAPQPLDVEQLRATLEASLKSSLEQAIRQELLGQMNRRWESALAARCAALKDELNQQVQRDLAEYAAQILDASSSLTNQRLMELAQLIEVARMRERQQVAAALERIEFNRLQDKTRLGSGLVTLAAQTNELLSTKQD